MTSDWKKAAVTFSTVVGVTSFVYKWFQTRDIWREVGKLESIKLYPIKSGAPLSVTSAFCHERGLMWHTDTITISDRMFVVYNENQVVTSRSHPELLRVHTSPGPQEGTVLFKHPKMSEAFCLRVPTDSEDTITIGITYSTLDSSSKLANVTISSLYTLGISIGQCEEESLANDQSSYWMKFPTTDTEDLSAYDCGDQVGEWLSSTIHCPGARLGYWPQHNLRDISKARAREIPIFKLLHNKYTGAFSNLSSYLLLNKSSFEDLRERLGDGTVVYEENFRANLTVTGAGSYEEDHWEKLRIGDKAGLRIIKKCVRCILITVNPFTLEKDRHLEPLRTLKTYRQLTDVGERQIEGDSPVMGCYVGLEFSGEIKIGDKIIASVHH